MGHVAVGQADPQDAGAVARQMVLGVLEHRRAEAAGEHVLLDGDDELVLGAEAGDQLARRRAWRSGRRRRSGEPVLASTAAASLATCTPQP